MSDLACNDVVERLISKMRSTSWYCKIEKDADELATQFMYCKQGAYGSLDPRFMERYLAMLNKQQYRKADLGRALLLARMRQFTFADSPIAITNDVKRLYVQEMNRLAGVVEHYDDAHFDLKNDVFLKDLAIVSHRFIPVGAEFIVPNAAIERSLLLRAPLKDKFVLFAVIARSGGFAPFFELHAHPQSLNHFNEQGWLATYRILADLLEANPTTRGVFSASWFLDPAIAEVSPRLAYLRETPARHGAVHIFNHIDEQGTSGALATSPSRRGLFEQGKYKPCIYTRIWPGKSLTVFGRLQKSDALFEID